MSKLFVSVAAFLVSAGVSWAEQAPYSRTLTSHQSITSAHRHMILQTSRRESPVPAKRVKAFSFFAPRPVTVPEGYGLPLGRIKAMIDVRNDQLHYGR